MYNKNTTQKTCMQTKQKDIISSLVLQHFNSFHFIAMIFMIHKVIFLLFLLLLASAYHAICEGEWVNSPTTNPHDYFIHASRVHANPRNLTSSSIQFLETVCPLQVAHYSCYYIGNVTRAKMLEHRRWIPKPPTNPMNTCIPFRPSDFLELMRGRKMYIIGDSIMTNFFTSLFCSLYSSTESQASVDFFPYPGCGELLCPLNDRYHSWNRGGRTYFRLYDFSIVHLLEDHLGATVSKLLRNGGKLRSRDIIVYNSGLHYNQEYPYEVQLHSWRESIVNALNSSSAPQLFFMETSPQHFPNPQNNGYYLGTDTAFAPAASKYSNCIPSFDPRNISDLERLRRLDWRNIQMRKVLKPLIDEELITIIPIVEGLYDQYDAHIFSSPEFSGPSAPMDCTHWCFPGNVDRYLNLMFYNTLLRRLQKKNVDRSSSISLASLTSFANPVFEKLGLKVGDAFRAVGYPSIYLLDNFGYRRPFHDWDTFVELGFNIKQVKSFNIEDVQMIPMGEDLTVSSSVPGVN